MGYLMSALQLRSLAGLFLLVAVTGTSFAQDPSGAEAETDEDGESDYTHIVLDDLPAAAPISGLGRNQRSAEHPTAGFFRPTGDDIESVAIDPAGRLAFPPVFLRQRREVVEVGSCQIGAGGVDLRESGDNLHRVAAISFRGQNRRQQRPARQPDIAAILRQCRNSRHIAAWT